ncbi:MAG: hypothetical protein N2Z20_05030 [Elusimicrobiales bacterium]|nr:hypothetical protein [Elusimicrobiales bacterium]
MKYGVRIRILNYKNTIKYVNKYDVLYFGTETCENLVFFYEKYLKDLFLLNKIFIISLPPLSQKLFEYSKTMFLNLKDRFDFRKVKFSINDFGTLTLIKRMFPNNEIFVGRHLSKAFFSLMKDKLTINSIESIKFLKKYYNVSIYEISSFEDEPLNNLILLLENNIKVKFVVHTPYVLLSTARNCIIGFKDIMPEDVPDGVECNMECLNTNYLVEVKSLIQKLYLIENSIYKKISDEKFINSLATNDFDVELIVKEFF